MLILSRKQDESIVIADNITVTILEIRGTRVRFGIQAPGEVPVHREETKHKIDAAQQEWSEAGDVLPTQRTDEFASI